VPCFAQASGKQYAFEDWIHHAVLMLLLLLCPCRHSYAIPARAAHCVWAFSARGAHIGSYYAIKYVDPIWNGTTR
jgi:hypothetical protein